jgi:hypothetical protein
MQSTMHTVMGALCLSFSIYICLGILSIYVFGSELHASVLKNVNEEDNVFSLIIRACFLVVLACHIPYVFFPTKESLLIMVDELQRKSMSKAILYGIQQAHFGQVRDRVTDDGEDEGESALAYQKMNACQYLLLTMLLYGVIVTMAIFVDDLSTIFDLIGAFGFSFTSFILPAVFYLRMTGDSTTFRTGGQSSNEILLNRCGAYFLIALGLSNMTLVVMKTIDNNHADE